MVIHHLLERTEAGECAGVITYIDFVAAFDSIYHSYMLESLKTYGVPLKYISLVEEYISMPQCLLGFKRKVGYGATQGTFR